DLHDQADHAEGWSQARGPRRSHLDRAGPGPWRPRHLLEVAVAPHTTSRDVKRHKVSSYQRQSTESAPRIRSCPWLGRWITPAGVLWKPQASIWSHHPGTAFPPWAVIRSSFPRR